MPEYWSGFGRQALSWVGAGDREVGAAWGGLFTDCAPRSVPHGPVCLGPPTPGHHPRHLAGHRPGGAWTWGHRPGVPQARLARAWIETRSPEQYEGKPVWTS